MEPLVAPSAVEKFIALQKVIRQQKEERKEVLTAATIELATKFDPLWRKFASKYIRNGENEFNFCTNGFRYFTPGKDVFKTLLLCETPSPPPTDEVLFAPGGVVAFLRWLLSLGTRLSIAKAPSFASFETLDQLAVQRPFFGACSFDPEQDKFEGLTTPNEFEKSLFSDEFLALVERNHRRSLVVKLTDDELKEEALRRNIFVPVEELSPKSSAEIQTAIASLAENLNRTEVIKFFCELLRKYTDAKDPERQSS